MKNTAVTFLRACSLSVALAGSVALVAGISLPDQAFADNGKGNGGGNGNGNGNGGGNGAKAEKSSGNSGAAKGGKETTKATKKTTKKTTAKKTSTKKAEKAPLDDGAWCAERRACFAQRAEERFAELACRPDRGLQGFGPCRGRA
jgi:hypothetical protein